MKRFLIALATLAALVWSAWYIAVPGATLEQAIEDNIRAGDISAEVVGLKKGLFMSIGAEGLDILSRGERLLSINDFSARLDPSGVVGLKAVVPFEGTLAGGELSGLAELGADARSINARVKGADIAELGLYQHTGLRGTGRLDARLRARGHRGTVEFEASGLELQPASIFGIRLPVERLRTAEGKVHFSVGTLVIEKASFGGEGIGAVVTGEIVGGVADLQVRVTVQEAGAVGPLLAALLEKYMVSPGQYVVPIRARTRELFTDIGP